MLNQAAIAPPVFACALDTCARLGPHARSLYLTKSDSSVRARRPECPLHAHDFILYFFDRSNQFDGLLAVLENIA
jgi:hypothetical protein